MVIQFREARGTKISENVVLETFKEYAKIIDQMTKMTKISLTWPKNKKIVSQITSQKHNFTKIAKINFRQNEKHKIGGNNSVLLTSQIRKCLHFSRLEFSVHRLYRYQRLKQLQIVMLFSRNNCCDMFSKSNVHFE